MHARAFFPIVAVVFSVAACGGGPEIREEEAQDRAPPPAATPADRVPLGDAPSEAELPDPAPFVIGPSADGETFGGEQYGFPVFMSRDGKLIALYRYPREPELRPDGSSEDVPVLEVFDRRTNDIETYDELVAVDPLGRHAVLREAAHLYMLDIASRQRTDLTTRDSADIRGDDNACMAGRQVMFDPLGRYLAWLRTGPDRIVVRDLTNRDELEVETRGARLWRAEPTSLEGWVLLHEVPGAEDEDAVFPVRTSGCECRHCARVADRPAQLGPYRGEISSWLAGPTSRLPVEGDVIPLGDHAVGYIDSQSIRRADGNPYVIGEGCTRASFVHGVAAALVACPDRTLLVYPSELEPVEPPAEPPRRRRRGEPPAPPPPPPPPRTITLTTTVTARPVSLSVRDAEGHHWIAVLAGRQQRRLGRLRLEDGRLELGPPAQGLADPHATGWALALTSGGALALHVGDGRLRKLTAQGATDPAGLAVTVGVGTLVLAPESGRAFRTPHPASFFTNDGCALQPESTTRRRVEIGPWRVRCPEQ